MSSILLLLILLSIIANPRYVGPAGKNKKATNSTHNNRTCNICSMQESVGVQILKSTNPNYICIFKHVNWKTLPPTYPHPFPLTSLPNDRIEKMITVAQRILLKIKKTKNPVYLGWQPYVDKLEKGLWNLRSEIYVDRIIGCARDPKLLLDLIRGTFQDSLQALVEKTGSFVIVKDDYKLWATFTMVTNFIVSTAFVAVESALKSPTMLPKDQRQMSKNDHFFEVVDKIINVLDQTVVPHSDLAAIACGGKTEQSCNQCHKKITIEGIFHHHVRKLIPKVVFNHAEKSLRYVCESPECWDKESRREMEATTLCNVSVYATFLRFYDTRCVGCFLLAPLKDVHRSMCLTKNYCSQICRDADNDVHEVCCNLDKKYQKVNKRKIRIGGRHHKTETANARIDSYAKNIDSTGDPGLDKKIQNIIVKTKRAIKVGGKSENQIDEVD